MVKNVGELVIAAVLLLLTVRLWRQRRLVLPRHRGFDLVLLGLALVTAGAVMDSLEIQDRVWLTASLRDSLLALELLVGYLMGILLTGAGLGLWVPALVARQREVEARLEAERRLGAETDLLARLVGSAPGVFYLFDSEGRFVRWNRQFEELTGYSAEDLAELSVLDTIAEPDRERATAAIERVRSRGQAMEELRIRVKDGQRVPVVATGAAVEVDGSPHVVGMALDISDRVAAEELLRRSSEELEARNEALQLVHDLAGRLHRTLDLETIARETVSVLVHLSHPPQVAFYLLEEDGTRLRLVADHGFDHRTRDLGAHLPVDGSLSGLALHQQELLSSPDISRDDRLEPSVRSALLARGAVAVTVVPLVYQGQPLGTLNLVYREVAALETLDLVTLRAIGHEVSLALANAGHLADLEHLAYHDPLTGLGNRARLHQELERLGARPGHAPLSAALILLDLARFKEINQALGHEIGDRLLVQVGLRLAEAANPHGGVVCRLGGDEFAVLLRDVGDTAAATAAATRLLTALARPLEVGGGALVAEAAAGVAVFPEHTSDSLGLLRCADVAMYHAKQTSVPVATFEPGMDHHTPARLALMADLKRAIADGELVLHYQPKVSLADGRTIGVEALVRWRHPAHGLLPPSEFVPLAEVSDLIEPLSCWVMETALGQLNRWRERGFDLTVAVNLSSRNLLLPGCSAHLEQMIRLAGVDPARVELEITETALMSEPETALANLRLVTAGGTRLAIDDFGTGYSSLVALRRLPIDTLKIDRAFVADMLRDRQSFAIVESTIHLAHNLGLTVVAEGVEDRATADALREAGCDQAQGFHFARPAPAEETERWLATRRTATERT